MYHCAIVHVDIKFTPYPIAYVNLTTYIYASSFTVEEAEAVIFKFINIRIY